MVEGNEKDSEERPARRWGVILLIPGVVFLLLVAGVSVVYVVRSRNPHKAVQNYLRKAVEFAGQDKYAEAVALYRKALVLSPDNERIRRAIALAYVRLNEVPKAITEYREYLKRKPDDRNAQYVLARLYLLSGNVYEAKRITDAILLIYAEDIAALSIRAQCHAQEKQFDMVAQDLQQIIHLAPGWAPPYLAMAGLELKDRDLNEAEQYLKRAVAASPGDVPPIVALGNFYAAQKKLAEAEGVFLKAIGDNPKNEEIRVAYGLFLSSIRRLDEAAAQYQRVLSEDPSNVPALMGATESAIARKQMASAMGFVGRLLKTELGRPAGLYYRGIASLFEGEADKAIEDLQSVARESPHLAQVHYLLGIAYLRKNDVREAKGRLSRALQLNPALTAAQLVLAEVLMATGNPSEAVAEAEDVLKKQADNLRAILIAGQAYLQQGAPEKARQYFEKSVQVDRESVFPRMVLARIYQETGSQAQALQAYREIIEINPSLPSPYYLLGTLYYESGDYERAIEHYRKAIEKEPNYPPALNNLAYAYAEHGGDLDEAQRTIEPLAGRFPQHASIQDTFAWVLFKKEMYAESLRILEAIPATKRDERISIAYHYGLALYKNRKEAQARAELEKVLPRIRDEAQRSQIKQILSEIEAKT